MHMLYNSDSFAVLHIFANAQEMAGAAAGDPQRPLMPRHGFEIVDKRSGKEVYLDGSWAELFQRQIEAWQQNTPTQEEVEDTLESYASLAQTPVVVH
ncbi:BTH_I0359 family protein [Tepidimonas sp.]|uniref:BTH_I0359 family protein n=1 Tax=Tepidimonas sp. TaxID=2002775 RepID=UPI002FE31A02